MAPNVHHYFLDPKQNRHLQASLFWVPEFNFLSDQTPSELKDSLPNRDYLYVIKRNNLADDSSSDVLSINAHTRSTTSAQRKEGDDQARAAP
jgi:hypothetical protein